MNNIDKNRFSEEERSLSGKQRFFRYSFVFALSLAMYFSATFLLFDVWNVENPKTSELKHRNSELRSRLETLVSELDVYQQKLSELQVRDNHLYRPIFGLNEIPEDVRSAGVGGVDRYAAFDKYLSGDEIRYAVHAMDKLYNMVYVQSCSLDEVGVSAIDAANMASSIPTISPVNTDGSCRLSSPFCYRIHPIQGTKKFHSGIDLAGKIGTPVYATGDGVVETVGFDMFGYGRYVIINHGFGYKTRYAHLSASIVSENQKVTRGMQIAKMGNTGRSTGPHLHYEVIYKGRCVNPRNYFDFEMNSEQYSAMINSANAESR